MKENCYIYGLRAKDETRYFYVGSTKHNIIHRWKKHQGQLKRNRNLHFSRTITLIGVENVVCELLETVSADKRFEREAYWINKYSHLTNIVKNPAAIILRDPIPTTDEIESLIAKTPTNTGVLSQLVVSYAESAVKAMKAMEVEMAHRRAVSGATL